MMFCFCVNKLALNPDLKIMLNESTSELMKYIYRSFLTTKDSIAMINENIRLRDFKENEVKEYLRYMHHEVEEYKKLVGYICEGCLNPKFQKRMVKQFRLEIFNTFSSVCQNYLMDTKLSLKSFTMLEADLEWLIEKEKFEKEVEAISKVKQVLSIKELIQGQGTKPEKYLEYLIGVYPLCSLKFLDWVKTRYLVNYLKDKTSLEKELFKEKHLAVE